MNTELKDLYDLYAREKNFSGAALIRTGDRVLFAAAYGDAHKGFRVKNTIDTSFDTASITKLYTAVAVLQLVEVGKLSLQEKIVDVIDLQGTQIPGDVTIAHLLTHTSGIADDADEEAGEKYEDLFRDKPNYALRKCSDFLPQFAYKEPNFKAGTDVRYCNCSFVLLGLAIEERSKESYSDYVTRHIFDACGLQNTGFFAKDQADAAIAEGYFSMEDEAGKHLGWQKNIYSYPPVGTADGGAFTSVPDLDRFIRALKDGKLLSAAMTAEILRPQTPIERKYDWGIVRYGYAFEFTYDNDGNLLRMYKDGSNPGVAAMVAYIPALDVTNIVLGNQTCNVWELNWEAEQAVNRILASE